MSTLVSYSSSGFGAFATTYDLRTHLRLDDDYDENELRDLAEAASALVANYLGDTPRGASDEADRTHPDPTFGEGFVWISPDRVVPVVRRATIMMAAYLFRYRDEDGGFSDHGLPKPVMAMLYPLRGPTIA